MSSNSRTKVARPVGGTASSRDPARLNPARLSLGPAKALGVSLPFPLSCGQADFFGFRLEGMQTAIDPFEVAVAGFRIARGRSLVERVRGWLG
jgi:hypothetical protein